MRSGIGSRESGIGNRKSVVRCALLVTLHLSLATALFAQNKTTVIGVIYGADGLSTPTNCGAGVASTGAAANGNAVGCSTPMGTAAVLPGSYTFYLATTSACSTPSTSGIYVCAKNNVTGNLDYEGTDAAVVVQNAINNIATVCGTLHFKAEATPFPFNSLTQETASGFSNYYAVRIPNQASSGQYCQWVIEGEGAPPVIDQFAAGVMNTGTIFYVTPTALASVSSTVQIMGFWTQPIGSGSVSASVIYRGFDVRFPNNQRGNETGIDSTQALNVDYEHVTADTNVQQASLAFPVAGTLGMIGFTSTLSSHEENVFYRTNVMGYDTGYDIQSEHASMYQTYAQEENYCYKYGVNGSSLIYHPSVWSNVGCGESSHDLLLGANLQSGTRLTIQEFDIEDAAAGTTFANVYHAKETNAGYTSGYVSWGAVRANVGTNSLANFFDGGGGTNFIQNGFGHPFSIPGTNLGALAYGSGGVTPFPAAGAIYAGASVNVTHGTSTTFDPTGLATWGQYTLEIDQDATGGGNTFALGTGGSCSSWNGSVTLSTGAHYSDALHFTVDQNGACQIISFTKGTQPIPPVAPDAH